MEADSTSDKYSVKIDGEVLEVTLDELQNGYQRQADYTRKTQELASERERLAQGEAIVQALEANPQEAVSALADAFGVAGGNQINDQTQPEEDLDPEEVRLRRMESSIEEHERATRQRNMQSEVDGLREKFKADINERELYGHALKHNIGNLEAAYAHMTYGDVQQKATNAGIVDEKRAANVVESTVGSTESSVSSNVSTAVNSLRDAFVMANQELSGS
tara:strand:- start:1095 stop:1751 length:657 start_codon:yes stop_codon:yes gene_type:complete